MGMREIAPFGLRMSPGLKERLTAESKRHGRSLNAEIVARLEASFTVKNGPRSAPVVGEPDAFYTGASKQERDMIALFRQWSAEQQLSFLVLFK